MKKFNISALLLCIFAAISAVVDFTISSLACWVVFFVFLNIWYYFSVRNVSNIKTNQVYLEISSHSIRELRDAFSIPQTFKNPVDLNLKLPKIKPLKALKPEPKDLAESEGPDYNDPEPIIKRVEPTPEEEFEQTFLEEETPSRKKKQEIYVPTEPQPQAMPDYFNWVRLYRLTLEQKMNTSIGDSEGVYRKYYNDGLTPEQAAYKYSKR